MYRRIATIVAVFALAVPLAGCSAIEQRFTPPPKVITEEATVAVVGAAVAGEMPDNAADLPLWPGAELVQKQELSDSAIFAIATPDPFDDVVKGVGAGFTDAGWDVQEDASGDASTTVITVTKGESMGLVTMTVIADGRTRIEYLFEKLKK